MVRSHTSAAVARPPWPDRRGPTAVARPPWPNRRHAMCSSAATQMELPGLGGGEPHSSARDWIRRFTVRRSSPTIRAVCMKLPVRS